MRRFEPPPAPPQAPNGPATEPVCCPFCQQATLQMTRYNLIQPSQIPEGTEPTPEQLAALLGGSRMCLTFECATCQQAFQLVYVQIPGQAVFRVLADTEGKIVDVATLQAMRQRQQAVARIVVPGRN